jgi:Holliday junction resolvase
MSRLSRSKGSRIEREVVNLHLDLGIHSERVPHSGATKYRGNGADIDIYIDGKDSPPLIAEVKARAAGVGFTVLERWLSTNDILFLRRDRSQPLVLLPWSTWARLVGRGGDGTA